MKKSLVIAVAAVALLLVSSAFAVSARQKGKVVGHPLSKVKLTVIKDGGNPVAVTRARFNKLTPKCKDGSTNPVSFLPTPKMQVFESNLGFKARYELQEGGNLVIEGKVKAGGRRVKGTIKSGLFSTRGTKCKVAKAKFRTKQV